MLQIGFIQRKSFPIQYKFMLLIVTIIVLTLIVAGIFIERFMVLRFQDQLASYARDIAYSVAEIPDIKKYIDWPEGDQIVQPIVEEIRKKVEVKYILAISGKARPVIEGIPYSSYPEVTTLGPTLRAYVPVYRQDEQVGAIAVYLWTRDINLLIWSLRKKIIFAIVLGLLIGIICAHFLAKNIKNSMFGMEPYQLASLLKEREALLESVKEGIVAADKEGKIVFMNKQARKMLGIGENDPVENKDVTNFVPNSKLMEVIRTGKAQYDQEQNVINLRIISNRIPIKVDGQEYGAIASFRTIDEMQLLAEELTGAKKLAEVLRVQNEALRVQKHDFLNKLHTISGLVQIGDYEDAISFMNNESNVQQEMIEFVMKRIHNSSIAGLLLGKMGRCRELGIELVLTRESCLELSVEIDINSILVCLGNLIENSMEAVLDSGIENKKIVIVIKGSSKGIDLSLSDTGSGITENVREKLFEKGFTTKKGDKRGYGLFLVKSIVDSLNGRIKIKSSPGKGTTISLFIPEGGFCEENTSIDR